MNGDSLRGSISVNFEKISKIVNSLLPLLILLSFALGYYVSFFFHFGTVGFFLLTGVNFVYRHVQTKHALLTNFGVLAQLRYMVESVGPEFRQYLFMSDTEETPFNRGERNEVYRKSKGIDSSSAFGSLERFQEEDMKLCHSMFPLRKDQLEPYRLQFGEERGAKNIYTLKKPILVSAMSYGALGEMAVRSLSRGAKRAGIPMNTGEGGYPKYHLMEGADLIFQMGTAKFGVRNLDGTLACDKLEALCQKEEIKMVEIKMSQGAKPGKGGLLPKEKVTEEIAELRGISLGEDVLSPPAHPECGTPEATVNFIRKVQEVSSLPVGIKLCLGKRGDFYSLLREMKKQDSFPDYLVLDGAEGGTGAAPKTFMDDVGVPLFTALPLVLRMLEEENLKESFKLLCSGKLVNPGKQFMAFASGAQAVYTARGFLLALGCIQALQCNKNTCPVGLTTHNPALQRGLNIEDKADRVFNYVNSLMHEHDELLGSLGEKSILNLSPHHLFRKG